MSKNFIKKKKIGIIREAFTAKIMPMLETGN